MGMRSVCPRLFLLVIIQGINLVYSPQEPVDVALDLPADSLETQSAGPNKHSAFSHSCGMNAGRRCGLWSSVILPVSVAGALFVTGILIM